MSSSSTPQSSEAIPTEAPVAETESLESAVEALSIDAPAEAPTALKKILQKPTSNDAKEPSSTENAASSNTVEEEDDWESAEPVAIPLPYSVHAAPFIPASANTPQVIENINSNRTEYVPQIKIMRREPKNRQNSQQGTSSSSSSASSPTNIAKGLSGRPSSPGSNGGPKTLAEREAEYRAARMRIFGKEEPEVDPEAASSETPVAAGPSNPSSQNPRPARTNTPPMRNNADGHPRIWTPTNQVNAVPAPGDRGFGLSRQPIPPPNNHPALWGGAPVLGRGGQPILTNPTYPGGPNAPFMPMNIGIAPPTLDPSAPRNAFALTPSGVPIPIRPPTTITSQQQRYPVPNYQQQHQQPQFAFPGYPGYPGPISSPNQIPMQNGYAAGARPGEYRPAFTQAQYSNVQQYNANAAYGPGGFVMYDGGALGYAPNMGFVPYDGTGNGGTTGGAMGQQRARPEAIGVRPPFRG